MDATPHAASAMIPIHKAVNARNRWGQPRTLAPVTAYQRRRLLRCSSAGQLPGYEALRLQKRWGRRACGGCPRSTKHRQRQLQEKPVKQKSRSDMCELGTTRRQKALVADLQ